MRIEKSKGSLRVSLPSATSGWRKKRRNAGERAINHYYYYYYYSYRKLLAVSANVFSSPSLSRSGACGIFGKKADGHMLLLLRSWPRVKLDWRLTPRGLERGVAEGPRLWSGKVVDITLFLCTLRNLGPVCRIVRWARTVVLMDRKYVYFVLAFSLFSSVATSSPRCSRSPHRRQGNPMYVPTRFGHSRIKFFGQFLAVDAMGE
jgi:hypothetical protein